jgi:hypothetical protein
MTDSQRRWIDPNKVKTPPGHKPVDLESVAAPRISSIACPELFIIDRWLENTVSQKFATGKAYDVLTGVSLVASLWHLPEQEDTDSLKAKLEHANDTGWAPRTKAVGWFRGVNLRSRNSAEKRAIEKCGELMSALVDVEDSIAEGGSDVSKKTLSWLHDRDDVERLAELFAWAKYSTPNLTAAIKKLDTEDVRYRKMWSFVEALGHDQRLVAGGLRSQDHWWRKVATQVWLKQNQA